MAKNKEIDYRAMPEYQEGFNDFVSYGKVKDGCPKDTPYQEAQKTSWLVGWLDARSKAKLGAIVDWSKEEREESYE